ncbi:MAG TPA: TetR family transcriptional regulator C-terminal domain-containing protein, partial [Pseudomonas sp.]|nr:TetR family transcriptional regulator C-terminal domain-containing protein [Pseudomonas sp.]
MTLPSPQPRRGRPPKLDRDQRETREALLHAGMRLLTEKGFLSTGIDAVLREVGVPKGSFYHYFASKEAFGRAVLERYGAWFAAKLDRWLLDGSRPPLVRLEDFVADARTGMARHAFRRGCLVGNLGQEVTQLPDG